MNILNQSETDDKSRAGRNVFFRWHSMWLFKKISYATTSAYGQLGVNLRDQSLRLRIKFSRIFHFPVSPVSSVRAFVSFDSVRWQQKAFPRSTSFNNFSVVFSTCIINCICQIFFHIHLQCNVRHTSQWLVKKTGLWAWYNVKFWILLSCKQCLQYELSAGVQVSPYLLHRFGSFFSLVFHYSKVLKS